MPKWCSFVRINLFIPVFMLPVKAKEGANEGWGKWKWKWKGKGKAAYPAHACMCASVGKQIFHVPPAFSEFPYPRAGPNNWAQVLAFHTGGPWVPAGIHEFMNKASSVKFWLYSEGYMKIIFKFATTLMKLKTGPNWLNYTQGYSHDHPLPSKLPLTALLPFGPLIAGLERKAFTGSAVQSVLMAVGKCFLPCLPHICLCMCTEVAVT